MGHNKATIRLLCMWMSQFLIQPWIAERNVNGTCPHAKQQMSQKFASLFFYTKDWKQPHKLPLWVGLNFGQSQWLKGFLHSLRKSPREGWMWPKVLSLATSINTQPSHLLSCCVAWCVRGGAQIMEFTLFIAWTSTPFGIRCTLPHMCQN